MDRALFASASGMAAQQQNLDTIAANLANADFAGFKGSVEAFAELAAPGESGLGKLNVAVSAFASEAMVAV